MEDVNAFDIYKMHKKAISTKPTYVFRGYQEILRQLPVQNAGKLYHNKSLSHHWNLRIAASILIFAMVKKNVKMNAILKSTSEMLCSLCYKIVT